MKKEKEQWIVLRELLKSNYHYNSDWQSAIDLFKNRITNKFLKPIGALVNSNLSEGEGFTILLSLCALVESLASFRTGEIFNHAKNKTGPKYEYNRSAGLYINFLHTVNIFENVFYQIDKNGKKTEDTPFNAGKFYDEVRCGLIHEGRTKGDWTINLQPSTSLSTSFIEQTVTKTKIYRTTLYHRLNDYLNSYCTDLADPKNDKMRRLFARKLDHLFEIERDQKQYDWWEDR